ncbi:threonylcarbamoyl-AMP synthase [Methanoculleus bourgensis]|jgi:L-threonylcarbamoyladenylate synthase|uniref:L-threonylcarbamoyladenylate synthase n=2 Tax=Methanoculleus bourgensis TaxID=83986 RepID=A0A0X3BIE1_9EURY|nr:L-threonylcarbamoyladenylate synthase [Methanoculleus bourgensis]MBT0732014.1 threonylcarbamoyl-AMP synthase [Methanoculleus bourgensis]MDD3374081.1 L-threonylcarbamoyladenylate synthase [Methanoculleus bourgensis]NMA88811.1 threonylcarbamoyl-AMP synthase [Methanoculleus bourgensis]NQS78997.1 threonylcarbamoyl-AMP synthase [Methanoculleus bourgensis]CCJ35317.1 tRNA threonylcarbamoyl adenosine modification protein [Methanoculleus bourgensis MS2]
MDPIDMAVRVLRRDGLIVYPTETVYGLGADALSEDAVLKVYEAKNRPLSRPISIAVSDMDMLGAVAVLDEAARAFIERFLPGPVTVVLPAKSCLPAILTGGTGLVGIRWPDHEVALAIIARLDSPITATSANVSGEIPPTRPEDVYVPNDYVVDGGELPGTPSTVVDLTTRRILRKGAEWEAVEAFLKTLR